MLLEKLKANIWKIFAGIGAVASAIFYVLFQQNKNEKLAAKIDNYEQQSEQLAQTAKETAEQSEKLLNAIKENSEVEKQNEKELQKASDNHLDGFNAGLDLLRK